MFGAISDGSSGVNSPFQLACHRWPAVYLRCGTITQRAGGLDVGRGPEDAPEAESARAGVKHAKR
ncbi:unnamed protein product, partial [Nesidiocoris tenuis]